MFPLCTFRSGTAIKLRDRLGRTAFNVAIESGNEACAHFLYQVGSYSHKSETLFNYIFLKMKQQQHDIELWRARKIYIYIFE